MTLPDLTKHENLKIMHTESEFNEFEPRLKSAKNRFQLKH